MYSGNRITFIISTTIIRDNWAVVDTCFEEAVFNQ